MNRNQIITAAAVALLALLAWLGPRMLGGGGTYEEGGVVYNAGGIAIGGIEPNPTGGTPLNIDNILSSRDKAVVVSIDGADTFAVPGPQDPEWADYLEFRRHFRSALDNSKGFAVAYDPEWRSAVTGVRPAPEPGLELFGGRDSIRQLVEDVVAATIIEDEQAMIDLAIRKEEFEVICWPSFPQSRPYLRVPWTEAWGFQYANLLGGSKEGLRQVEGRDLEVVYVEVGSVRDYNGWFRIHSGVRIEAKDRATGEMVELTYLDSIIERDGEYKVFLYKD
jgi:hypothetical protein